MKQYRRYFTTLIRKQLGSPPIFGLLALALLLGHLLFYLQLSGLEGWASGLRMSVMLVYAIGIFLYRRSMVRNKFASLYYEAAVEASQITWFVVVQFILIGAVSLLPPLWNSILFGIVIFGIGLHLLVEQGLMQKVANDGAETARYWQEVSS